MFTFWIICSIAEAANFSGVPRIVDGDTLVVGATKVRLDWRHKNNKTVILGALQVPINAQALLLGPSATEGAPSPNCTIKGNINRYGERIYHMQNQSFYARIRMDKVGGRRWFCTPEEAEAAGWRRALR